VHDPLEFEPFRSYASRFPPTTLVLLSLSGRTARTFLSYHSTLVPLGVPPRQFVYRLPLLRGDSLVSWRQLEEGGCFLYIGVFCGQRLDDMKTDKVCIEKLT